MNDLKMKETVCECKDCVEMCRWRPCLGTPTDLERIVDAGLTKRLMLDWWVGGGKNGDDILILSPAVKGRETGRAAELIPTGECTFLTKDGKCELHGLGLKPSEGRIADCKKEKQDGLHKKVAMTWNNDGAQDFAKRVYANRFAANQG